VQAGLTPAPLGDGTLIGVLAVDVNVSQLEGLAKKGMATRVFERGSL
jgi:hypothetical protein